MLSLTHCNVCPLQNGVTPVFSASWKGHSAVVQLLMENGADITLSSKVCSGTFICVIESKPNVMFQARQLHKYL